MSFIERIRSWCKPSTCDHQWDEDPAWRRGPVVVFEDEHGKCVPGRVVEATCSRCGIRRLPVRIALC